MMLSFYRALTRAGGPLIWLFLARRRALGKEDRLRFAERWGRPTRNRPKGPLVWFHAASVGEALSVLPVVEAILMRPDIHVMVTTGTLTSARLMEDRLPHRAFHQFVPVDRLSAVRRFLDHWRPAMALWTESELWPNLIIETAARDIPMILLNGRISPRSYSRWLRMPGLIRPVLGAFNLCLGQTEGDAERLRRLGARDARCLGNLKFATPPLPADIEELSLLRRALGGRPRWVAASTHPGEEAIAGEVHRRLAGRHPGLLTVIVPRHAQRGKAIAAELRRMGLGVAARSAGEVPGPGTDVYLADTMGELGLFYRLCPIAFVGKSLAGHGGQNPLEPARLGCPVLFGPNMANFAEISFRMVMAEAAEQVADAEGLAEAVSRLLADDALREFRGDSARAFANAEAGVLEAIMDLIAPFLDRLEVEDHASA